MLERCTSKGKRMDVMSNIKSLGEVNVSQQLPKTTLTLRLSLLMPQRQ
jgi:hypothetical protein